MDLFKQMELFDKRNKFCKVGNAPITKKSLKAKTHLLHLSLPLLKDDEDLEFSLRQVLDRKRAMYKIMYPFLTLDQIQNKVIDSLGLKGVKSNFGSKSSIHPGLIPAITVHPTMMLDYHSYYQSCVAAVDASDNNLLQSRSCSFRSSCDVSPAAKISVSLISPGGERDNSINDKPVFKVPPTPARKGRCSTPALANKVKSSPSSSVESACGLFADLPESPKPKPKIVETLKGGESGKIYEPDADALLWQSSKQIGVNRTSLANLRGLSPEAAIKTDYVMTVKKRLVGNESVAGNSENKSTPTHSMITRRKSTPGKVFHSSPMKPGTRKVAPVFPCQSESSISMDEDEARFQKSMNISSRKRAHPGTPVPTISKQRAPTPLLERNSQEKKRPPTPLTRMQSLGSERTYQDSLLGKRMRGLKPLKVMNLVPHGLISLGQQGQTDENLVPESDFQEMSNEQNEPFEDEDSESSEDDQLGLPRTNYIDKVTKYLEKNEPEKYPIQMEDAVEAFNENSSDF